MQQKRHGIPMIMIEGNVGVGKSTFLNYLNQHLDIDVIFEPNQLWQNVDGYNLLEQFFLDQKRWAYTCQSYILCTRIDQIVAELCDSKKQYCFIERSMYSGRYCFAKVAQEIELMNGLEWRLYQKLWDREIVRIKHVPAGFIYLRTSAENCLQRIKQRGRFEEEPITLDYLKRIEEKYENWFMKKQGVDEKIANLPVLVLDFTQDLTKNSLMQEQYLDIIKNFLAKLK
ncbi:deoxynucleoside kinase [Candidatus Babeliales bacterium]|nr:deoxynucleoside kinase [Candidatus Babeliales bacterium]